MANWRQIQGRIRRARTSADPLAKLAELFQKTRDAMVAFEAATLEEKAGRTDEAIRWYTVAAERFRRADWRLKAAEALTRLGAPVPEAVSSSSSSSSAVSASDSASVAEENEISGNIAAPAERELRAEGGDSGEPGGSADSEMAAEISVPATKEDATPARPGERHGRRRGRRGGRRHKRHGAAASPGATAGAAKPSEARPVMPRTQVSRSQGTPHLAESVFATPSRPASEAEARPEPAIARFVPEPTGPLVERSTYIRAGDPALASRFAQLESMLRRLISAPLHRVDELEDAPAGPGVFLLSDSDLMTNYYVEACQTLRIGTSQLARAGRAGRGARTEGKASLRAQMAEHLSINDTQVTAYLAKHCVVRWLQLDEDAPHLAHFAIALLRPALNVE
ncbi:MAG TPA: hypothetical protein VGR84_01345 [Candidatus Acidoferrales bacterium]|nr:hypothetical protein [Candidatus Acidoferrales bacterium]